MNGWILLIFPMIFGLWGLALLFNVFGAAKAAARDYRGRGDMYPILDGDQVGTHRFAGWSLISLAVTVVILFAVRGMF